MNLITIGLIAAASALFACGSSADASSVSPRGDSIIVTQLAVVAPGSLAWAGEDETLLTTNFGPATVIEVEDGNVEMMTAIVAPEPPAIVLAGMALGGVLCGRSLLRKRGQKKNDAEVRS